MHKMFLKHQKIEGNFTFPDDYFLLLNLLPPLYIKLVSSIDLFLESGNMAQGKLKQKVKLPSGVKQKHGHHKKGGSVRKGGTCFC